MNVDMDTEDWLGCPTPLEMYQHQCSMLQDDICELQRQLTMARANIAGLIQMNDALALDKAILIKELKTARDRLASVNAEPSGTLSYRSVDILTDQRDHLFRENQRLLGELRKITDPKA
ncbi:hypothetical protein [Pseudomonas sp. CFT9]|uniref:hypothetical protein n=1 Tax=unclassified Pseudomonas TaxID=196821 RepID=UPI000357DAC1|nr:hypothetical protein [Pseudomonas sp. CFT9]EPJ90721.1 hypothetical protein CFT9_01103 [Pseudomonas sp. CFT9]OKP70987.1 hypothetical protein BTR19_14130 [Pseudomonas fluorescens]